MATKAKNVDKPRLAAPPRVVVEQHADHDSSDLDVSQVDVVEEGSAGVNAASMRDSFYGNGSKRDEAEGVLTNVRREVSGNVAEQVRPEAAGVVTKDETPAEDTDALLKALGVDAPATPAKKGRPKKEEAPGAPKKKKAKKKGLVSASPSMASNPSYYYDIQNFIVTDSRALESFGCVIPPAAHVPTQVGRKVEAPTPPPAAAPAVVRPPLPVEGECCGYTKPGLQKVLDTTVFCPDCGLRIKKHYNTLGEFRGEIVDFFHCPREVVA